MVTTNFREWARMRIKVITGQGEGTEQRPKPKAKLTVAAIAPNRSAAKSKVLRRRGAEMIEIQKRPKS
jgi:hypothetical protein